MAPKDIWDPKRRRSSGKRTLLAWLLQPPKLGHLWTYGGVVCIQGASLGLIKWQLKLEPTSVVDYFSFAVLGVIFLEALLLRGMNFRLRLAIFISACAMLVTLANWPTLNLSIPSMWRWFLTIVGLAASLPLFCRTMEARDGSSQ